MPFGDGTGPRGLMMGRGAGPCTGNAAPRLVNFGPGWACTGGGGRGWRNRYYAICLTDRQRGGTAWMNAAAPFTAPVSPDLELTTLKTQAENLTRTLDSIRKQIETLEAQGRKDAQ